MIQMKPEMARKLAVRMSQVMERYDHWGYQDLLGDYEDSEELMLEELMMQMSNTPEIVFSGMLDTMEQMLDDIESLRYEL